MSQIDLEINREIRKVLVRHWIDLGQLSIRSTSGKASIRGEIHRIEGFNEELTSTIVDRMFAEIRRIPAISRINIDIQNWNNKGGMWRPIHDEKTRQRRPSSTADIHPSGAVFQITDRPPPGS